MIARPNLDLLSALAPAAAPQAVAILGSGAQNLRFDAAMLQAAKTVRDGSREGVERTLAPKVEQALESLLNQLAQQPAEQVRQWASHPDLLKPAVVALAQAHGLNAKETAELVTTAPMATQALIHAFDSSKAVTATVVKIEAPEPTSGPQGREPGTKTVEPAKTLKPQAPVQRISGAAPYFELRPEDDAPRLDAFSPTKDERKTEIPATLTQGVALIGTVVSTRTDDGSSADSSFSLASRPAERSSETVAAPPVSVKVSSLQPQASALVPAVPEAETGFAPVLAASAVVPAATSSLPVERSAPGIVDVENSRMVAPAQAPQAERQPGPMLVGKAPVTEEAQAPALPQATPQVSSSSKLAGRPEAPQRTEAGIALDFSVTAPSTDSQAPAIQDGSLFVLNGDGSSQGARQVSVPSAETGVPEKAPLVATQAPKAVETAGTTAPSESTQAPKAVETAGTAVPSAPTQAPKAAETADTTVPAAPTQASRAVETADVQAPSQTPVATAPAQSNGPLPSNAPTVLPTIEAHLSASVTPLAAPVTVPVQAEASQPLGASPQAGKNPSKAESGPVFEPKALENSAGFQALQRSSQEDAPQSGLAFGQETLRHLVTQVARELGIREAAFTQVSDALAQATGKENSHLVIKLKPATLGEVQVDLSMEGGKLTARLLASTAEVRDAFVRDLPAFKANLEAQGLRIDQVSVAVRAEANFNPQGQNQGQAQPQAWAFNRTLAQAAPELAGALNTGIWNSSALNDQLFSALA